MSAPAEVAPTRLAGDAATLAVAAVLTQGAGIIAMVILARTLPLGEFGLYQQLVLLYGIVAPLLYGGIPAALTFFIARSKTAEEQRGWAFDGSVALAALGVLFGLLLIVARHPLAEVLNGSGKLTTAIALLAPYAAFSFVSAIMPNALIPVGRVKLSAVLSAASALVYVVCLVGAAVLDPDVRTLAIAMGVSGAFSATVGVIAVGRAIGYRRRWRGVPGRSLAFLSYGFPLALTGLAGLLGFQFDRLVVSNTFSPEVFAIYAVGAIELPITIIIQQSINSVLLPALTRLYHEGNIGELGQLWRDTVAKTGLIVLPLFVLTWVLADDLMRVALGGKFAESVEIFRIYLLLMPLRVATYGLISMAIGRTKMNLTASLILLGSNVVLALALVGPLGLNGPAIATVIATTLSVAYYLSRLRNILGLPIRLLFPWHQLTVTLGIALAVAAPLVPIVLVDFSRVLTLVAFGAPFVVIYVAVMRRTGRIGDDDWARLRATVLRLRPGGRAAA